jgi:hypothetical protein
LASSMIFGSSSTTRIFGIVRSSGWQKIGL